MVYQQKQDHTDAHKQQKDNTQRRVLLKSNKKTRKTA